jgi:ABC-type transport system involved in cytochrome bd biosynthesis fused ATPase/permease subunit
MIIAFEPFGAIIVIAFLIILTYLFHLITRRKILDWGKLRQIHSKFLNQHLMQGLGGIKDVKIFNKEFYFSEQYNNHNLEFAKIEHELNRKQLESKAMSAQGAYSNAVEISKLRRENFNENNARYLEGLISTSDLLTSLRSLHESQFNELKQKVELEKSKYMIYIYNSL